ncbi:MAG: ABC transporter ATP-binding protein [Desulfurococcales archaeon]|nr:ABC transporter ATP-binding protein [Desulfurococcales archaeon]
MVEVRLERVSKRFGRVVAVNNVNLQFPDGKFSALLGPSGSGKSTILYLIAGIYKPTLGKILFGDRDVTELPPKDRNVGLVFQNYALYPHMTVYDNIAFPLRLKKIDENAINDKVNNVSKLLRIQDLLERYPHQLSGGQQQRVALARALVKEPEVLLLDEPLSNLDALLRLTIRAEIKRLQQKLEITAIHVTHDQAEAMSMADYIAVIDRGSVQQVGSPWEVYNKPRNLFVATFMGSPPSNVLPGRIVRENGIWIDVGGSMVKPPERMVELLRESELDDVIVAFRPEHASIVKEPEEGYISIPAEVFVTEPLGRESIVTAMVGGSSVKVLMPPEAEFKPGESVYIQIQPDKLMLFDPITELNIEVARPGKS